MCGNRTTNVTNTGLGDEQFKQLQTNQTGLGNQIQEGFTAAGTKLDSVDRNVSGLGFKIDNAGAVINENTNTGFTNLSGLLEAYGDTLTQGQSDAASGRKQYYDNMLTALQNNTGGLQTSLDTGFAEAAGRFDDIDQSTSNIQTSVDQGFQDATADRTQMQTDINTAFDDQNTGLSEAFTGLGNDVGTAFDTTNTNISSAQSTLQEGQTGLENDLSDISGNLDAYGTSLVQGQQDMSSDQDFFQSSFDDYVDRYSDDMTLSNQARSDLATAQANATAALRDDIGSYSQAISQGQSNLGKRLGALGEGTAAGFEVLSSAVEGGFSEASIADQLAQQNLSNRIGNVKTLLETTGENLDANTRSQYETLANSFDASGKLIANSIDSQGNQISRALDEQGNIIETTFDASGDEIGKVQMDIEAMLSNAETYQRSLTGQLSGLTDTIETGQESLMADSAASRGMIRDQSAAMALGFNSAEGKMDTQIRDLARVASSQGDIALENRQEFKQIGDAFDDQGNLIRNSMDSNGNTLSRAIDDNGNLLLRSFDVNGQAIGDKVLNINKSLNQLAQLPYMAGANASMGNLSPVMKANVPQGGFMSPFAQTR